MAYTINKTNGAVLTTVADGTIDNTADLTLIGKNYSGYGEILNENFVKLMENFASSSQPSSPLSGQLWWDLSNNSLKVYTGTGFKVISGSTASATQPASATLGDLWFDTVNAQLRVYNGATWTLIGPSFTAGTGTSGAVITTVLDNTGASHVIVQFYVNEVIVAILSKDSTFTPQSTISGFPTISPGIQISNSVVGASFVGTALNADLLDNLNSTQFIRSDANANTTGQLGIKNDSGVTVGVDDDLRLSVSGSTVLFNNNTSNGNIDFRVNRSSGGVTTALAVDGTTGNVTIATTPPPGDNTLRIATTAFVTAAVSTSTTGVLRSNGSIALAGNLLPDADSTRDLGSSIRKYADIYTVNLFGNVVGSADLSGIPTAPTAAAYTDTTQIATTAHVAATVKTVPENAQTGTTYTLAIADAGKLVTLNNAAGITLTVPTNGTVAFPIGTRIDLAQFGAGQVTLQGATVDVVIRSSESKLKLTGQYSGATLWKRSANVWLLVGDLVA